ncbi:hypothetical protein TNCV_3917131 [Trichonephila clavipes]|nr:hypothetical protein TNCV_3917131 [Trichonephila clavipes]
MIFSLSPIGACEGLLMSYNKATRELKVMDFEPWSREKNDTKSGTASPKLLHKVRARTLSLDGFSVPLYRAASQWAQVPPATSSRP